MLNEEYEKGKEIGELGADIKNLASLMEKHIGEQHIWNGNMEVEVNLLKAWVQTKTGKGVVITALFGVVGSLLYLFTNWALSHFK